MDGHGSCASTSFDWTECKIYPSIVSIKKDNLLRSTEIIAHSFFTLALFIIKRHKKRIIRSFFFENTRAKYTPSALLNGIKGESKVNGSFFSIATKEIHTQIEWIIIYAFNLIHFFSIIFFLWFNHEESVEKHTYKNAFAVDKRNMKW